MKLKRRNNLNKHMDKKKKEYKMSDTIMDMNRQLYAQINYFSEYCIVSA